MFKIHNIFALILGLFYNTDWLVVPIISYTLLPESFVKSLNK